MPIPRQARPGLRAAEAENGATRVWQKIEDFFCHIWVVRPSTSPYPEKFRERKAEKMEPISANSWLLLGEGKPMKRRMGIDRGLLASLVHFRLWRNVKRDVRRHQPIGGKDTERRMELNRRLLASL